MSERETTEFEPGDTDIEPLSLESGDTLGDEYVEVYGSERELTDEEGCEANVVRGEFEALKDRVAELEAEAGKKVLVECEGVDGLVVAEKEDGKWVVA